MDFLVEKLTELGVADLVPYDAARSVTRATSTSDSRRGHWQRIIVEAARQCGRATLMHLHEGRPLASVVAEEQPGLKLVAALDSSARPLWEVLQQEEVGPTTLVVGPEGDFEDRELAGLVQAGFRPVGLGPTVLRLETAATIAAAAVVLWASGCGAV
jgi:16S rRNA (uracil1498-N3)-methyltransferase